MVTGETTCVSWLAFIQRRKKLLSLVLPIGANRPPKVVSYLPRGKGNRGTIPQISAVQKMTSLRCETGIYRFMDSLKKFWKKRERGEKSFPLFSTGRMKPFFNLYSPYVLQSVHQCFKALRAWCHVGPYFIVTKEFLWGLGRSKAPSCQHILFVVISI